jgi:hypothetical protein
VFVLIQRPQRDRSENWKYKGRKRKKIQRKEQKMGFKKNIYIKVGKGKDNFYLPRT